MTQSAILAAILFLVGPKRADAEAERLYMVAQDISAASEATPIFRGADNAAALIAVGFLEGGFREDVMSCHVRGDKKIIKDGSVTTYQLLGDIGRRGHTIEALCSDNRLASQVALEVMREKAGMCRSAQGMLNAYNTGSCTTLTYMSKRAMGTYKTILAKFGKL